MKSLRNFALALLLFATTPGVHAQGTLVYDQESSTDESYPVGGPPIQFYGTVGQSFTPSLSTVGFVRLRLDDVTPGNALGATLTVNLRANAINGPVLGTTMPVVLGDGFRGASDFIFATAIPVVPNTTYFFETIVHSGDNWGITIRSDSQGDVNYPGGVFYGGLTPFSASDLWFREGIILPEPSTVALILGGGAFTWLMRKRRQCVKSP